MTLDPHHPSSTRLAWTALQLDLLRRWTELAEAAAPAFSMRYRAPIGAVRCDVFGRYEIDVERRGDRWVVYLRGEGKRREHPTLLIPSEIPEDGLVGYLEDLLHEEGGPGMSVQRIR